MPRVVTAGVPMRIAARHERRLRLLRHGVLVHRDRRLVERDLRDLAREPAVAQVDEHQVIVGSARHDLESALDERRRERPRVGDDLRCSIP